MMLEDGRQVLAIGGGIEEGVASGFGIKEAAHGVEFSEVKSENVHRYQSLSLVGWMNVTDGTIPSRSRVRVTSFNKRLPPAKPRTYMDSFGSKFRQSITGTPTCARLKP
jgi:hypothetical protein